MVDVKALFIASATLLRIQALALPKLRPRGLAEIGFYEDCKGFVQTPIKFLIQEP